MPDHFPASPEVRTPRVKAILACFAAVERLADTLVHGPTEGPRLTPDLAAQCAAAAADYSRAAVNFAGIED